MTTEKIAHLLTGRMRGDLDALLVVDSEPETTPLAWLTTPAVEATAAAVKLAVDKLLFLPGPEVGDRLGLNRRTPWGAELGEPMLCAGACWAGPVGTGPQAACPAGCRRARSGPAVRRGRP